MDWRINSWEPLGKWHEIYRRYFYKTGKIEIRHKVSKRPVISKAARRKLWRRYKK